MNRTFAQIPEAAVDAAPVALGFDHIYVTVMWTQMCILQPA